MAIKESGNREQDYRRQAVERRDKRGKEEHSEADPAQAEAEGQADRAADLGTDRRRVKRRIHVDSAAVLPDGGAILKEVRKMKRVPTLMDDVEFQEYLDRQKKAVEEMKKDGLGYISRLCQLTGRVTATSDEEKELCFTASQLDQIFDLAK